MGIARGLGSQGRRTGEARVDLDDTIVLALRVEGVLHVALADDADMAHDLDGERTQLVILAIGQSLRRSDDDTLTRMDAQRVEVLHVADRDAVVVAVAHHLVLYLLPALEALLHQHQGREREGLLAEAGQLLLVVCEATTQSAQRIGSTDDDGVAELLSSLAGLLHVLASLALDGLDVDLVKLLDEELAVLRVHDGLHRSTQDAHAKLLPARRSSPVPHHS